MKKLNLRKGLLSICLITTGLSASAQATGKVWAKFENYEAIPYVKEGTLVSDNIEVNALIQEFSILNVTQAVPSSRREDLQRVYEFECNCDIEDLMFEINSEIYPMVNAQQAPVYELLAEIPDDYNMSFSPDWALDKIKAIGAWEYSTGDTNVIIGISDGNFYTNHEDLIGEFVDNDQTNTSTYYNHGTAVAITAAGSTNNGVGKSSIGYKCRMNLAGMNYNSALNLTYAGCRVLNISWTSGCWNNTYVQDIIDEIYDYGTIIIAAAGNGGTCGGPSNLVYPAACDHVIAVSSTGIDDSHEGVPGQASSTHQHNSSVDICAPGYNVPLSIAPGVYLTGNGTSFAAPIVSGTVGLMVSLRPCLTFEEVELILKSSASQIDYLNPDYIGGLGAGRLDAASALRMTSLMSCNPVGPEPPIQDADDDVVDSPFGIEEVTASIDDVFKNELNVTLFPNPSNGDVSIHWNEAVWEQLKIVNSKGQIVMTKDVSNQKKGVNLQSLENGVYYIELSNSSNQIWRDKLIVI